MGCTIDRVLAPRVQTLNSMTFSCVGESARRLSGNFQNVRLIVFIQVEHSRHKNFIIMLDANFYFLQFHPPFVFIVTEKGLSRVNRQRKLHRPTLQKCLLAFPLMLSKTIPLFIRSGHHWLILHCVGVPRQFLATHTRSVRK